MKYLTDIDLSKNELQNARIQNLAADPSNGVVGQIYYNTVDKIMYQFDGTNWKPVGKQGTVTSITAGTGLTGGTITESGTIAHADTSSQSSITASSRTYINSVTLDGFGHVTALGTGTETVVDTDSYVNQASFANDDINNNIKMTLTRTGTVTGTVTANIPKVSSTDAGVLPKFASDNQSSTNISSSNYLWDATQGKYAKMPASAFTDTKVTQTAKTDNVEYKILTTSSASPTSGSAGTAAYDVDITINPSTNTITATNFNGTASKATADASGNNIINTYAPLASPTFTGTPTAPTASAGTNTTQIATTQFVTTAISGISGGMYFKGTIGTDGTAGTTLPTTNVTIGDTYKIVSDGTYAGQDARVGDLFIATATTPTWAYIPSANDVTQITAGAGLNTTGADSGTDGGTITTTGTLNLTKTAVTPGTYQGITVDKYGRVTGASNQGYITGIDDATKSAKGKVQIGDGIAVSSGTISVDVGTGLALSGTSPNKTVGLDTAYGDTVNPYGSKTANYILAAPNGSAGTPSFRAMVAADLPSAYGDSKNPYGKKTPNYVLAGPASGTTTNYPTFRALVAKDIPDLSGTYLALSGGTMTGAINMNSHAITGVTDPESAQDAATKNYVDTTIGALTTGAVYRTKATNPALTASGGAWTWTITTPYDDLIVSVYEVSSGNQVYPDVSVDDSDGTVTIVINDTANVTTLAANTYKAVILGSVKVATP